MIDIIPDNYKRTKLTIKELDTSSLSDIYICRVPVASNSPAFAVLKATHLEGDIRCIYGWMRPKDALKSAIPILTCTYASVRQVIEDVLGGELNTVVICETYDELVLLIKKYS